jgi:hypothetical protein
MKSVIQLRKKERKTLLKKAEKYLEKLEESLKPLSAIVFGSVSRGDFNDASDIDILVIAEGLPTHPLQRFDILLAPCIPGVDPKGYTPSEFERLQQKKDPFIKLILKEGIILKDELNIFN